MEIEHFGFVSCFSELSAIGFGNRGVNRFSEITGNAGFFKVYIINICVQLRVYLLYNIHNSNERNQYEYVNSKRHGKYTRGLNINIKTPSTKNLLFFFMIFTAYIIIPVNNIVTVVIDAYNTTNALFRWALYNEIRETITAMSNNSLM